MTELWAIESAGVSHVGLKRRVNEDAWMASPEIGLFAVADGMGGHQRGDIASRRVVEALVQLDTAPDARTMRERVEAALAEVNRSLLRDSGGEISGSTVVVLLVCGPHFAVLWAGDSRIYRANGEGFVQLTRDHSAVQELVERGEVRPEEARSHRLANRITRAVGAAPDFVLEGAQGELQPGDAFLLCSDGLTRHVEDAEIHAALDHLPPQQAAERLINLTLARGAVDNVTVVSLRVNSLGSVVT